RQFPIGFVEPIQLQMHPDFRTILSPLVVSFLRETQRLLGSMHRLLPLTGFGMSRSEYVHINRHFEFCPFTDHPGVFNSLLPVADGGIGACRQELSEIISGDIPTSSLGGRLEIRPRFR